MGAACVCAVLTSNHHLGHERITCPHRHLAAAEGCYSVAAWLISLGAQVNLVDRFKRTPLEVWKGAGINDGA